MRTRSFIVMAGLDPATPVAGLPATPVAGLPAAHAVQLERRKRQANQASAWQFHAARTASPP